VAMHRLQTARVYPGAAVTEKVLSCRVSAEIAAKFVSLARQTQLRKTSRLLSYLVAEALRQQGQGTDPSTPTSGRLNGPTTRTSTTLSVDEARRLQEIADAFGGVSAWLRSRVRLALGDTREIPAEAEVTALHDATVELWHVGKNLNQVAKAINEARVVGRALPIDSVTPDLVRALALRIETLAEKNEAVIAAARRRGRAA
jgi:hypothetical protein